MSEPTCRVQQSDSIEIIDRDNVRAIVGEKYADLPGRRRTGRKAATLHLNSDQGSYFISSVERFVGKRPDTLSFRYGRRQQYTVTWHKGVFSESCRDIYQAHKYGYLYVESSDGNSVLKEELAEYERRLEVWRDVLKDNVPQ